MVILISIKWTPSQREILSKLKINKDSIGCTYYYNYTPNAEHIARINFKQFTVAKQRLTPTLMSYLTEHNRRGIANIERANFIWRHGD